MFRAFRQLPSRRKLIAMIMATSLAVVLLATIGYLAVDYYASREDLKPSGDAGAGAQPAAARPEGPAKAQSPAPKQAAAAGNGAHIGIEDFARLDLRVGQVLECALVDALFWTDAGDAAVRRADSLARRAASAGDRVGELCGRIKEGMVLSFLEPEGATDRLA